jgi:hypothetical protein
MKKLITTKEPDDAICDIHAEVRNMGWSSRARIAPALLDAAQYLLRPGNRHVELRLELRPAEATAEWGA